MNRKQNHKGSTVIEAMTAVVILGCAATVLAPSYLIAMRAAHVLAQSIEALTILDNEFTDLLKQGFAAGDLNTKRKIAGPSGKTIYEIYHRAYPLNDKDINKVEIGITWPAGGGGVRSFDRTTYVFDERIQKEAQAGR